MTFSSVMADHLTEPHATGSLYFFVEVEILCVASLLSLDCILSQRPTHFFISSKL